MILRIICFGRLSLRLYNRYSKLIILFLVAFTNESYLLSPSYPFTLGTSVLRITPLYDVRDVCRRKRSPAYF